MPSFACPKCNKVLKTAAPIPAGKKVKCPACAHLFVMPELKEQTAVVAKKPAPPPGPAPMASAAERTKPRRPDADEEAPRKAARKAKARDDEPADEEEDEDRPKKRKKKKPAEGNKNLLFILGGAGALVVVLVIVLFVWPGLLLSGGNAKVATKGLPAGGPSKGAGALDPLAFVPSNAEVVIGVSFVEARKNADETTRKVEQVLQTLAVPPAALELMSNADRGIFAAAGLGPGMKAVAVLTTLTPVEAAKVTEAFNAKPQSGKGKNFYRLPGSGLLALPDSKTIVLSTLGQAELEKLLEGKGKLAADMQAHVDAIGDKTVWGVVKLSNLLQDGFRDKEQEINELAGQTGGTDAVPAIKNAKFARFYVDGAKDKQFKVEVECASDEHAGKLETYAKALWEGQGKKSLGAAPLILGNLPGIDGVKLLIGDVTKTFRIERQGPLVSASLTITENTQKELAKIDPLAFMAAAGAAAAQPGQVSPPPPTLPKGKVSPQANAPVEQPKPPVPMPDAGAPKQAASVPFSDSLVAAPLPEGYQVVTQDLNAGPQVGKGGKFGKGGQVGQVGKSLGKIIVVSKPNQISKVVVQIETRDLTAMLARRVAAKGYVSTLVSTLAKEGYRLVDNTMPNIDIETFENPISVKLAFVHANGAKLWTHQEIFFTNVGYAVQVIANDEQTLANLTAWAKTVKPKT